MKIQIAQLRLELTEDLDILLEKTAKGLGIKTNEISDFVIKKISLDARKKQDIHQVCVVTCMVDDAFEKIIPQGKGVTIISQKEEQPIVAGDELMNGRPVIVGTGPCGLLAGYRLAKEGYRPILIERGKKVEERVKDVERLWTTGLLNETSNVVFGEGGAGTFSDGKLTWRGKDVRAKELLSLFVSCGAPADIAYQAKAHIGSDRLRAVLIHLRNKIEQLGGTFLFERCVTSWYYEKEQLKEIKLSTGETISTNVCVLAMGHSARDTFSVLYEMGVAMEAKPFAVGFRIEHEQQRINEAQYGAYAEHPKLGAADYQLTHQAGKRGVYSFCMCPGGQVVCSASEQDGLACNGMSLHARNDKNANAAIIVQVTPQDFGNHPLDGVAFQRYWEQKAYQLGGGGFVAPVQRVGDFLKNKKSVRLGSVQPSYLPGTKLSTLEEALPAFCIEALKEALPAFDRKIRGFADADAILTGVETRTSSPLRIMRNDRGTSITHDGLYPAGEGAGYAGGIMSAGIDGLHIAEHIIERFARPKD